METRIQAGRERSEGSETTKSTPERRNFARVRRVQLILDHEIVPYSGENRRARIKSLATRIGNQQSWAYEAVKGLRKKGKIPGNIDNERELAYVLDNFADFDAIDAVQLRRIKDIFEKYSYANKRLVIATLD